MIRGVIFVWLICLSGLAFAAPDLVKGHDSSLPVEITSDSLEVHQEDRLAIFEGKVEAVQGDVNLRSDKMVVHYKEPEGDEEVDNSVSKIDVLGNVFLSTLEETAKGEKGVFDVEANVITLEGDVMLTRGKNVVKGDHLVYNMATGKSKITSKQVEGKTGRVRGVFMPEKSDSKE